jgi:hypothetical protein
MRVGLRQGEDVEIALVEPVLITGLRTCVARGTTRQSAGELGNGDPGGQRGAFSVTQQISSVALEPRELG